MKTVPLKVVEIIQRDGTAGPFNYLVQLEAIVREPTDQQGGMDIDELGKSLRLIDVFDAAELDEAIGSESSIELEDQDYSYLGQKVKACKFQYATQELKDFIDDVTGA